MERLQSVIVVIKVDTNKQSYTETLQLGDAEPRDDTSPASSEAQAWNSVVTLTEDQPIIKHATTVARGVRTTLLRLDETPRNLAGACGLAAMLVAKALNAPRILRTGFYMKSETLFGQARALPVQARLVSHRDDDHRNSTRITGPCTWPPVMRIPAISRSRAEGTPSTTS